MGIYINPGNAGFYEILQSEYIDKTGLIVQLNKTIGTMQKLTCISRPRRFGKSYAAKMLCAYYDCSCDSHSLFEDKALAQDASYRKYLNQCHVISLDISGFISAAKRKGLALGSVPDSMVEALLKEITDMAPELPSGISLTDALIHYAEKTGKKFVFVIDEWDALIREAKNDATAQEKYLNLLREWFKNNSFTPKAVAAAYITGILPIKKDGSQSAISDFIEYSVLYPDGFAEYTGFTEGEVEYLCSKHNLSFEVARKWYDGYIFPETGSVYNPYSLMCAVRNHDFRSYWRRTSAAESLMAYVNMDFGGMQETITRLLAGEEIEVDTESFENDFETFRSRDDVLTLLVHLGYLTWNSTSGAVRIPNEEVRVEFRNILHNKEANSRWTDLIQRSEKLVKDAVAGKEEAVAQAIQTVHESEYAPTFYNNEQALRYVVKFAFIAALDQYLKVEELPSGHGIADVVYIPKRSSVLPAMIIELKWNKTSGGALEQIKSRKYPEVLKEYGGEMILIGIVYQEKTGQHECKIEKWHK